MRTDQQNTLLQLFTAHTEGTITPPEYQKLQTMLRTDREARVFWYLHQDLELGLKRLTQMAIFSDAHPLEQPLAEKGSIALSAELSIPSPKEHRGTWGLLSNRSKLSLVTAAFFCLAMVVMFRASTPNRVVNGVKSVESASTQDVILESPTHGTRLAVSQQEGKVVALHFLLKTECPFCLKLVHDYSQIAESDSNVVHLFIKPDNAAEIIAWAKKINLDGVETPPVVYRDPDARLAKQYHVPDGYLFHGQSGHYPALVALDPSGKELFRYVGTNNTDRMQPADFHARLAVAMNHN